MGNVTLQGELVASVKKINQFFDIFLVYYHKQTPCSLVTLPFFLPFLPNSCRFFLYLCVEFYSPVGNRAKSFTLTPTSPTHSAYSCHPSVSSLERTKRSSAAFFTCKQIVNILKKVVQSPKLYGIIFSQRVGESLRKCENHRQLGLRV